MIRTVLWDNDGVLVDTERLFYRANREIFLEHGFELSLADFFRWFLLDNCGGWHLFRAQGHTDETIRAVRTHRNRRFSEMLAERCDLIIEEMEHVLTSLAPRVTMGLVTSSSKEHLSLAHRNGNLLRHFQVIVTEEDCTETKPSPEPYLIAMNRLGVRPHQCVAIEDSPRGFAAATAAGIACIVVSSDLTAGHDFHGSHAVVKSCADLLHTVEQLL